MSQYDFGTIDPYVVDGVQLASMLNNWRDAVHSWHRGASRPSYIVPGQMWINDAGGATNWIVNVYISPGIGDLPVFTYNTTAGTITVSAAAGGTLAAAILLAQAAASPSVRWNASSNPVDAKAWRSTVDAAGALVLSSYTDAGVVQNSITFNRDGSTSSPNKPALQVYNEQVLVATATEIRVAFAAGAKHIEVEYWVNNNASADFACYLQAMQGATPVGGTAYNYQNLFGVGATPTAQSATAQVAWTLGTAQIFTGYFRPRLFSTSSWYGTVEGFAQQQAGARIAYTAAFDATIASVTGFRITSSTGTVNFAIGSFLRLYAAF